MIVPVRSMRQNISTTDSIVHTNTEIQDSVSSLHNNATSNLPSVLFKDSIPNSQIDSLQLHDSIRLSEPIPELLNTETQVKGEKGIKIFSYDNDWMVGVLLFAIIFMAVIRFSFSKYLLKVFDSVINYQTSSNLFLEKNMRNLRGSIFLNLLFYVNLALFLVQYAIYNLSLNQEYNNIFTFLYCFGGLLLLYSGKFVFIRLMGYIFDGIKECKEYLHTVFIYNKNLGVFLLPITISVPFIAQYATPLLLNIGLLLALAFYLLRLFRGIKILFRQHVSIFYMILYLCALEILPLLMIYKLLYLLV